MKLWGVWAAIALCGVCLAGCATRPGTPPSSAASAYPVDPDAQIGAAGDPSRRLEELQGQVEEGTIHFSINADPAFADGRAEGNLLVANLAGSRNRFTVEIRRQDTGETLYRSGAILPGKTIETIRLTRPLAKGTYPCTAYLTAYRLDEDVCLGQAGAQITLHIAA